MHRTQSLTTLKAKQPIIQACSILLVLLLFSSGYAAQLLAADAEVIIRNLEDINFGVVPPTVGDMSADAEFCVAMEPRGRYTLIGRGNGPAGGFDIIETGNRVHSIAYSVQINDRGRAAGSTLLPGVALSNLRASRQNQNGRCTPASQIRINVSGSEIQQAGPGRYEGTLSLTVVPE